VLNGINTTGDISLVTSDSTVSTSVTGLVGAGFYVQQGTLLVYVDDSQGNVTPGEQAAIDDAIANYNAQLAPLGATLVEVSADQASSADITIAIADTSDIGGVAQGVLGVTEMGGMVTLVNGWNWYVGSDPSQIGPDQFDFETIAAHELGHAIGLGHSPDLNSVMYPVLAPGQVRRTLTANDLSELASDTGGAPEALMAAPASSAPSGHTPQAQAASSQVITIAASFADLTDRARPAGKGHSIRHGHGHGAAHRSAVALHMDGVRPPLRRSTSGPDIIIVSPPGLPPTGV
jgi:hypothetical protein